MTLAVALILLVAAPVCAGTGELQWGTCAGQFITDSAAAAVPSGSRVELWDVGGMPPRLLATAVIGDGSQPAGQFAATAVLDVAEYVLQVRVFDTAAPLSGAPASCAVVAPGFDTAAPAGLFASLDPFDASLICIDSAQIPDQAYAAGQGGCSASLTAACADFVQPWGVDVLDISAAANSWPHAAPTDSVDAIYDLNRNQQISVIDLVMASSQWGQVCL